MDQMFNSLVSSRGFDPFTMEFETADATLVPLCPEVELAKAPPAPVMPKPATHGTVKSTKPAAKLVDTFGVRDVISIRLKDYDNRAPANPSEKDMNQAWLMATKFTLRIVMREHRGCAAYECMLAELKRGLTDIFGSEDGAARYHEMKRDMKRELAKAAEQTFKPAAIIEPAPGLEPMVPTHVLCRELMAAAPADIEEVAASVVGTLKGDDRYAKDESARKQLIVDAKARVIALLLASGVSPEEALRRGERALQYARPLRPKKAAPITAATTGPARPLTADEIAAMLGGAKVKAVEKTAKPMPSNGTVRTPEEIEAHHAELERQTKAKDASKRERAEAEAKARDARAAKAAAEAKAAEEAKKAKAKAAEDAAAKAEAKRNKGKHSR